MTAALNIPLAATAHSNSLGSSATGVDTRTLIILAFSATAGVLVEFYDFAIFGFVAASAFPAIFFPKLPATQALVFSFLAYAAGHPARLLGAFLFGHFGDRAGRKFAFLINIIVVGASTFLTGLLPGYATIGIAAPILLVTLRIIQGIGVGGEFGGATSLLAEFGAKRRHRAFWISLADLGLALGLMVASAMFLLLRGSFGTTGWRIAMLFSLAIVIPAVVARYKLADSPLFEQLKQRNQLVRLPSFDVFRRHVGSIFLLGIVAAFQNLDTVVTGIFIVSFMNLAGIPLATAAIIRDHRCDCQHGGRAYDLYDGPHRPRPGRYPRRQPPCAGCDHTEALALAAGRSDPRGGWRTWLRLPDLVWSMGACWHSCPSGRQTSEGHRTRACSA
jgi:MFS transporter, MHS family, shikimate and dehydroshikimate transport protein